MLHAESRPLGVCGDKLPQDIEVACLASEALKGPEFSYK